MKCHSSLNSEQVKLPDKISSFSCLKEEKIRCRCFPVLLQNMLLVKSKNIRKGLIQKYQFLGSLNEIYIWVKTYRLQREAPKIFFASKKRVYKNAVKDKHASMSRQEKVGQDRNQIQVINYLKMCQVQTLAKDTNKSKLFPRSS